MATEKTLSLNPLNAGAGLNIHGDYKSITIPEAPTGGYTAAQFVVWGQFAGFIFAAAAEGEPAALVYQADRMTLAKPAALGAITAGANLFINSSGNLTATATDTFIGYAYAAAAAADTSIEVVLNALAGLEA